MWGWIAFITASQSLASWVWITSTTCSDLLKKSQGFVYASFFLKEMWATQLCLNCCWICQSNSRNYSRITRHGNQHNYVKQRQSKLLWQRVATKKGKCSPHINSVLLPSRSKRCRFFSSWENRLYVLLVNIYPSLLLVNYKVLKFMETSLQTLIKAYSSIQVWWGKEVRWASSC